MDEPRDRLDYLTLGHVTGALSEAEEEELASALQQATALRRQLAWHLAVDRLLRAARSTRSSEVVVMATLPRAPDDTMARVMRELPLRPRPSRTAWVFAGSAAAAAAAVLLFAGRAHRGERSASEPVVSVVAGGGPLPAPPPPVIGWTIGALEGDVRRGNLRATEGDQLAAGDELRTAPAGSGAILVGDEGRIELGAGTVLQNAVSPAEMWGTVRAGSALVDRVARAGGQPFGLLTAQARITSSGARFAVTVGARQTRVDAWSGAVSVRASRGKSDVTVQAHQSALIDEGSDHVAVVASDRPVLFIIGTVNRRGRLDVDQIVRRRLEGAHHSVTVTADNDVTTTALRASALVVVSSSVDIGILGTQLRDLAVPIVVAEPWLLDDLGMTEAGNEDNQAAFGQQLVIVGNDHPLAAGLSGPVEVADASSVIAWGRPNAVAVTIATYKGWAERAAIFGYEKGDAMPGLRAPARRVFLFMHDGTAAHLTGSGWALFDAAIEWAIASP